MSANEEIRTQLLDMGIDGDKAREAAVRYNTIEAALNWVFGEGESVSFSCSLWKLSLTHAVDAERRGDRRTPKLQRLCDMGQRACRGLVPGHGGSRTSVGQ